ncbi:hypothetical protein B566_EDAN001078 [Ephemera danica]|nr:hypothetical protein B566_EDAN001078 [Ephemera danica]
MPKQACLDKNLQPVERPCLRDLDFGAVWGDPTGECEKNLTSASTSSLLRMAKLSVTPENAASVTRDLASALQTSDNPSTADVALVADALVKISRVSGALTASCIDDLTSLMDGVLKSSVTARSDLIEKDVEATSSILSSVDKILENLQLDSVPEGMAQSFSSRAALLVADVDRSGVTGVAALAAENQNEVFSAIRPLRNDDKLEKDSLEISARLLGGQSKGRASFVIVGTRRVFPQRDEQEVRLNSRVVGVTLTGDKDDSHGALIEFEVRPLGVPGQGFARKCAFWDLKAGEWSTEGCRLVRHDKGTGRDVCQCSHLTHFGEIIGVRVESAVLDVISLVGCVLSLLGLVGIALTAILFKQWRSRLGNKILLHLSFAIGLTMVAFLGIALGGASGGEGDPACIFLGVLMHYSVLASFCWMLISASLQLLRFVVVISARPPHFLLKGVLVGWVVPIVPVFVLLALGPAQSYDVAGEGGFCYPHGVALAIAVILPVAIVVIANLIFFCIIIYRVSCGRDKRLQTNMSAMSESRMAVRQLKMSVLLFFLLGLSWIFGLFALLLPTIDVWKLIFSYLFCATATLQGLALFLFFIAWERKARALWLATLPDAIGKRAATSDSTSGVSPSTGTMSGTRTDDEAVPLKKRGSTTTQSGGRSVSNNRATKTATSGYQSSQK